jgi:hypothetical protein
MNNNERREFLRRFWIAMEVIMEEKRLPHSKVVGNNTSLAKSRELNPTIVRLESFANNLDMDFNKFMKKLNEEMELIK